MGVAASWATGGGGGGGGAPGVRDLLKCLVTGHSLLVYCYLEIKF